MPKGFTAILSQLWLDTDTEWRVIYILASGAQLLCTAVAEQQHLAHAVDAQHLTKFNRGVSGLTWAIVGFLAEPGLLGY
jgi:hypothetical protein